MAIKVNSNFEYGAKLYGDVRQSFATIADMAGFNSNLIPDGFITFCEEDSTNYQWLELNTADATLGKWRKFTPGGGDIIDDSLDDSTSKTYSITKIKELVKASGGFVLVDTLPDLDDTTQRDSVEVNKIYLVPSPDGVTGNEKDEYICVVTKTPAEYREPLVTSNTDYDTWKAEIIDYVGTDGGSLTDDFTTYSSVKTTTTMTAQTYAEMIESINSSDADYNGYVARVSAEVVVPEGPEVWAWEYIGSLDGATVTITDNFIPNNPIGKIAAGVSLQGQDIVKVVMDMLSVDEPTTIALTGAPSATLLNEKGVSVITDVVLSATITLGTGTIDTTTDIIFKKAGVEINRQTYDGSLTYVYSDLGANIDDNVTYSVEVAYTMNDTSATATNSITYQFALPFYYGVSSTAAIADPTALTKLLSASGTQAVSYTADNAYLVFCIPDTKTITSIKDVNNFENVDSWSFITQAVGTNSEIYKIYTTNTPVTCTAFGYTITLV